MSKARLIEDKHQPFGYHIHTELPQNKNMRRQIDAKGYDEAVRLFFREARRVVNEEK